MQTILKDNDIFWHFLLFCEATQVIIVQMGDITIKFLLSDQNLMLDLTHKCI